MSSCVGDNKDFGSGWRCSHHRHYVRRFEKSLITDIIIQKVIEQLLN